MTHTFLKFKNFVPIFVIKRFLPKMDLSERVWESALCLPSTSSSLSWSQLHSKSGREVSTDLTSVVRLLENSRFQRLLDIHNIIQAVQCFQCPPAPLCCDAKVLVREVSSSIFHFHQISILSTYLMPSRHQTSNLLNKINLWSNFQNSKIFHTIDIWPLF